MQDLSGKQIDDYLLLKILGHGHFGEVYLAEHIRHKRQVALKILYAPLNGENIHSFLQEARSTYLEHPHIVRVSNFGVVKGLGVMNNDRPYIVMQYTPHGNLRQRHPKDSCLSWESIVPYLKQVAEALQYIHDEGWVHRDIKPENMLIGFKGEIWLSDFGISTTSITWRPGMSQKDMGTPAYIPPEQISGEAVRASDQYALGAVTYEWLTGQPVFTGNVQQVILQHMNTKPTPLRQKVPTLPQAVEDIVMKMLEKDPHNRFASMREFVAALDQVDKPRLQLQERIFTAHTEDVQAVSWSPDGKYIASTGREKIVHIWQPAIGDILYTYREHRDLILDVAWSHDSKQVASAGSDKTVHVWEATTGQQVFVYTSHNAAIRAVAWSPDDTMIASTSEDKTVQIWRPASGEKVSPALQHHASVYTCSWSPDGNFIATGDDTCNVYIWDVVTGENLHVYKGHTETIKAIAWSPNNRYIASAGYDCTVRIWNIETGQAMYTYIRHTDPVVAVAWSPSDSHLLASASWDATVHVWQTDGGKEPFIYRKHKNWVNTLSWSPDGKYLVSGGWDKTVHIFSPDRKKFKKVEQ